VNRIQPSARGELEITDAIQDLIDRGLTVHPHIVRGWWKDTGKLEDMLEANRIVLEALDARRLDHSDLYPGSQLEGRVDIGEGAAIVNSVIRGPVVIGAGARIENAFIGPYTSIGDGCTIERCELENSIILAGSELRRVQRRIDGSLIGRNTRIVATDRKPKAHRFMLGDNCEVEIS
jgi:glucose-1-phosphate thymidylyltransferase